MESLYSLHQLGWRPFFQTQLTLEEWESCVIARVVGQDRSLIHVLTTEGRQSLPIAASLPIVTVGDWMVLNADGSFHRLLDRMTLFARKAAGKKVAAQLIASNIDTVFVVCSMNQDFNLNRIERYLALANEAGVEPVMVLTKVDCCDNPDDYLEKTQALDSSLSVVPVNSLDPDSVDKLKAWCVTGRTVAFLGSSGVGKSTLINTLSGANIQTTNTIREDDDKGRHTTTGRSLHLLPAGGLLLDTPGMRELQLADCEHGIEETFMEITELASRCKFTDCKHQSEPGCAVQAAIQAGNLDERRLSSYLKLMREQVFNSATLAEKRARDRDLGRFYRSVQEHKRHQKE